MLAIPKDAYSLPYLAWAMRALGGRCRLAGEAFATMPDLCDKVVFDADMTSGEVAQVEE